MTLDRRGTAEWAREHFLECYSEERLRDLPESFEGSVVALLFIGLGPVNAIGGLTLVPGSPQG